MAEEKRRADFERFIERTEACWLWTGSKNRAGYGTFRVGRTQAGAHRWAWQWVHGAIPKGMQIHHQCRTPSCVNPAHLTLATARRNLQLRAFSSWAAIDAQIEDAHGEPLTVTLTPKQSAWVRARIAETGQTADHLVERALYRYITRWLGDLKTKPRPLES